MCYENAASASSQGGNNAGVFNKETPFACEHPPSVRHCEHQLDPLYSNRCICQLLRDLFPLPTQPQLALPTATEIPGSCSSYCQASPESPPTPPANRLPNHRIIPHPAAAPPYKIRDFVRVRKPSQLPLSTIASIAA